MLLHMAAAAVGVPDGRQRIARYLRAALALVEDDDPSTPPVHLNTAGVRKALEDLALALTMAAEHAEFLAERANFTPPRPVM